MIYDFKTTKLDKAKELIIKYRKTKDKKIFELLVAIFDDYLKYLIHKFKRKYTSLRNEPFPILYPTTIIGLEDACSKFHDDWDVDKVLFWIGSYVKYHLLTEYAYKEKETWLDEDILDRKETNIDVKFNKESADCRFGQFLNQLNIKDILDSKFLTSEENKFIKLKYFDSVPSKEIAKQLRVSSSMVTMMDKRICAKLKTIISEEEK